MLKLVSDEGEKGEGSVYDCMSVLLLLFGFDTCSEVFLDPDT